MCKIGEMVSASLQKCKCTHGIAWQQEASSENQVLPSQSAANASHGYRFKSQDSPSIDAAPTVQVKKIEIEWSVCETDIRNQVLELLISGSFHWG